MSGSVGGGQTAEPNLTPILDMVFQLITFFMLVINFKASALDLDLKLPVVGSAAPEDTQGQTDLLILNITTDGNLKVYGGLVEDIGAYIEREAQSSALLAHKNNDKFKTGDDLPSTVVIRADKTTPFKLLNAVIGKCQEHGFRKFALKAMNKPPEEA